MKNDGKKGKVVSYCFTRHDKFPERFVMIKAWWQHVYKNFWCLHLNRNNTNTPKWALSDVSNTDAEESSNDIEQPNL